MLVAQNTEHWDTLVFNLKFSKNKSNRDVLCLSCWEILTYEQRDNHLKLYPSHKEEVMTSKAFGSEEKFIEIA